MMRKDLLIKLINTLTIDDARKEYQRTTDAVIAADKAYDCLVGENEADEIVLLICIEEGIRKTVSPEFIAELEMPLTAACVSILSKRLNATEECTYLENLAFMILLAWFPFEENESDMPEKEDKGYEAFLLPGTYDEGKAFFEKYSEEFEKIKKAIRNIEYREDKEITESFALKFYKPELDFVS
jgi:hypothetical protein